MVWAALFLMLGACEGSRQGSGEVGDPDTSASASASAEAVAGLEGVEMELLNAVAPYDHASAADSRIVRSNLLHVAMTTVVECVNDRGEAVEPPRPPEHDREQAMHAANAEFPFVEALERDGLRMQSVEDPEQGSPASGQVAPETPEQEEAAEACHQDEEVSEVLANEGRYGDLGSEWHAVLEEIDASDEVKELSSQFSECLRDEGVPRESTPTEVAFLSHVDTLLVEAARGEQEGIAEAYGQLYVHCGRELFETRERLRAGERRIEFLQEHADAIHELNDLLYGAEGS